MFVTCLNISLILEPNSRLWRLFRPLQFYFYRSHLDLYNAAKTNQKGVDCIQHGHPAPYSRGSHRHTAVQTRHICQCWRWVGDGPEIWKKIDKSYSKQFSLHCLYSLTNICLEVRFFIALTILYNILISGWELLPGRIPNQKRTIF